LPPVFLGPDWRPMMGGHSGGAGWCQGAGILGPGPGAGAGWGHLLSRPAPRGLGSSGGQRFRFFGERGAWLGLSRLTRTGVLIGPPPGGRTLGSRAGLRPGCSGLWGGGGPGSWGKKTARADPVTPGAVWFVRHGGVRFSAGARALGGLGGHHSGGASHQRQVGQCLGIRAVNRLDFFLPLGDGNLVPGRGAARGTGFFVPARPRGRLGWLCLLGRHDFWEGGGLSLARGGAWVNQPGPVWGGWANGRPAHRRAMFRFTGGGGFPGGPDRKGREAFPGGAAYGLGLGAGDLP